jgi:hypothetical protein
MESFTDLSTSLFSFMPNSNSPLASQQTRPSMREGFQGLTAGPIAENSMMYLADVPTNGSCANNSLGLSNSKGYLCMTPEQIHFLQSRGGNATTKGDF